MVNLVIKQLLHGVDDALAAGNGAPQILAGLVPQNQLRLAALAILQIVSVGFEGLVGLGSGSKDVGLCGIEQAGHNEKTVTVEIRNLLGIKWLCCHWFLGCRERRQRRNGRAESQSRFGRGLRRCPCGWVL